MTLVFDRPVRRQQTDRIFFTSMALLAALSVFVGFSPSYFLRGAALTPLTPLYHVHGALFTAWIALFIVQTSLVAGFRTDLHRKLGVAGAVLAACVFAAGVAVSIETLRRGTSGGGTTGDPRYFFAIPMGDIVVFGLLVMSAVLLRRNMQAHKRLMLLASISLLTAAVARSLVQIGAGGPVGLFLGTDIFVAILIAYDVMALGRVHPATIWGGAMVAVFKPALFALSATPAWLAFADAVR